MPPLRCQGNVGQSLIAEQPGETRYQIYRVVVPSGNKGEGGMSVSQYDGEFPSPSFKFFQDRQLKVKEWETF